MPWSEWVWDGPNKYWTRYRLVGEEKYEFGYDYGTGNQQTQGGAVPRTRDALQAIPGPSSQYPEQESYTTAVAGSPTGATASNVRANLPASNHTIVSSQDVRPNADKFDQNYRVHHSREFQVGRVFKVLWAEPNTSGGGRGGGATVGGTVYSYRQTKHGEQLHAKVRRFVIVKSEKGSCICLSIMSYGERATTKPGVHAEDHAIIYTTAGPKLVPGEENTGMVFKPVKVVPDNGRHKLDKASRLNYAKLYTVEHNVKVWFIGKVHRDYLLQVLNDHNIAHPPLTMPQSNYYTYPPPTTQAAATASYQAGAASNPQAAYTPYSGTGGGNTGYSQQPQWNVATTTLNYPPNTGYGSNTDAYAEEQPPPAPYSRDDDLYDP